MAAPPTLIVLNFIKNFVRNLIIAQEPVEDDGGWNFQPLRPPDPKPRVQLPGENRSLSQFASDVGRLCASLGTFTHNGRAVLMEASNWLPAPLSALKFVTWAEEYVIFTKTPPTENADDRQHSISVQEANIVLASPQFLRELPVLRKVNPVRLPIKVLPSGFRLLPVGHDSETQVFTFPNGVRFRTDQPLAEASDYLNRLICSLPFAEPAAGKAALIASMLSIFALDLLPDAVEIPATIFTANGAGAGKTLCAKLCTIPVLGMMPTSPKPSSEAEMEKALFASALQGARVIVLDNVKEHLSSAALEQFLTSSVITKRLLGKDVTQVIQKKTVVLITGNDCTVSPDLRRRSLFVDLFLEHARPEDRVVADVLDEAQIISIREEILSALYSLVRAWYEAKCPPPTVSTAMFRQWNNVIGGIVEHAGFGSPLAQSAAKDQADPLLESMESLVSHLHEAHGAIPQRFDALATLAQRHGLFETLIGIEGAPTKEQRTKLGKHLARQDRKIFRPGIRFVVRGKGHQRRFIAERMQPRSEDLPSATSQITTAVDHPATETHVDHADHVADVSDGQHDGHDEHDPSEAEAVMFGQDNLESEPAMSG